MRAVVESSVRFRIYPLLFRLETTGNFHLPEYKGSVFRGGFGRFFRELVCVTGMPVCTGCSHVSSCPYSLVFETPVNPVSFRVLRKYPNAPHPFVLTPPLDSRRILPPKTPLELEATLIGRGVHYLAHFVQVIETMGQSGRYGGPFRLRSVVSALDGTAVYDGAAHRFLGPPVAFRQPPPVGRVERLELEFVTPLRMRSEGRPLSFVLQSTGHPVSPAALSRKKEANDYGDRDLPLCCWYVSGEIRRVHQVIEKGRGGQPVWPFVPCVFWTERQSDGVRCLVIAGGVRQVREDADAHPSTTRDRLGKAGSDARAQGDLAGTEGHVAREAGEGPC